MQLNTTNNNSNENNVSNFDNLPNEGSLFSLSLDALHINGKTYLDCKKIKLATTKRKTVPLVEASLCITQ